MSSSCSRASAPWSAGTSRRSSRSPHPDVEFVNSRHRARSRGTRHGADGLQERDGGDARGVRGSALRVRPHRRCGQPPSSAIGTFRGRGRGSGIDGLATVPFALVVDAARRQAGPLRSGSPRRRTRCAPPAFPQRASGAASRQDGDVRVVRVGHQQDHDLLTVVMRLDALDLVGRVEQAPRPSRLRARRASRRPNATHWPSW